MWKAVFGMARAGHGWFGVGSMLVACGLVVGLPRLANGELLYQENFEGDDSGYDIGDESYAPPGVPGEDWAPGVWGLNTIADQIGLQQNAPARRAAILWDSAAFADDFAPEALEAWITLTDWAVGITDTAARANARVGFYGGYVEESVEIIKDSLVSAGYKDGNITEFFAPDEVDPDAVDVLIHSNVLSSTAFSALEVPLISFSASDHDDTAIAGIGVATTFDDQITLDVPQAYRDHPALGGPGGLGADGQVAWTVQGPTTLQGIGKIHNGGKAIAWAEDPVTEVPIPAIFVIEEGSPLLGAFNPDPEGDQYIVGAALNKIGDTLERVLELDPVDVTGKSDLKMTVLLAATAADFENSDYLIIEADPDGNGPAGSVTLDEFYGVDEAHDPNNESGCLKGMSNGSEPGAVGDICLPAEAFGEFTYNLPANSTNLVVRFRLLNTWGNEIVGIDNIRIHSGALGPVGDFNGNGVLDAPDIDDLTTQVASGLNPAGYDLNNDGSVTSGDISTWVKDLFVSWIGDANLDHQFNSSDLVTVLASGTYETEVASVWTTGDFNGDGRTNSSDLVAALADGGYEAGAPGAIAAVPEPMGATLLLIGSLLLGCRVRRAGHRVFKVELERETIPG